MKVTVEITSFIDLYNKSWSGARETLDDIETAGKESDFMFLLEDVFFDKTPEDVEVNDFIWFERDYIYEILGLDENGKLPEEEDYE